MQQHPNARAIMNHLRFAQQKDAPYKLFVSKTRGLYEIHFSLRGPKGTPFEGGLYHGMMRLLDTYPHTAPDVIFLQRNGKFELDGPICLSYRENPGLWSPALGFNGLLRSVQSLFADNELAGVNIIQKPDPHLVETYKSEAGTFVCEGCGCRHAEIFDQVMTVEDMLEQ